MFSKGQQVVFTVLGHDVTGEYVSPVKVSAKYPNGGHKVLVHGRPAIVKSVRAC